MKQVVCYQYKTGKGVYFFSPVKVYNMILIATWKPITKNN